MDADTDPIEIMGAEPTGRLGDVFDAATGRYFAPTPQPHYRDMLRQLYLAQAPGADAARFDAVWPRIWELTEYPHDPSQLVAILDTGVLAGHPLLRDCLHEVVDFTGEGGEDRNGHGTLVTLLARLMMPGVPRRKFVVLKCVGADGRGAQANLIRALGWMQAFNRRGTARIVTANISLGVYNRKWLVLGCDGTCALCRAAVETAKEIVLSVAAGNVAGKTACPARAAFLPSNPAILAVGRSDEATSGAGTVTGTVEPTERVIFQPKY